jgi:CHAD domain-containing protein
VADLVLEAALPPEAVASLLRAPALAALRAGRSRTSPAAFAWLDTPDGALGEKGLALEAARRGAPRLIRTLPRSEASWRPGSPPEESPGEPPDGAQPLAAFAGSVTRIALAQGVQASVLRGRLRAVLAEAPVARLVLEGPAEPVIAAMRALAETAPLLPPRAALAEEARALARGEAVRPRRLGPPRLDPDLDIEAALTLALGHLTEVLLWHAPAAVTGATPEGVHQMRVAIRRLRSLLRAFRGACDGAALRDFDAGLKALATLLGPARDWDVWLGGQGAELAAALGEEPRLPPLLAAARRAREAAYAALRPALEGPPLRRLAWQAIALIETRPWREEADSEAEARRAEPLPDFAARVLDRRWRRIAEAGAEIEALPDPDFHALRIEAKRLRYAAELFAPLWGRRKAKRFLAKLAAVQEEFGLANDAVVARALMARLAAGRPALAWASGAAEGWALARARRVRRRAQRAWEALLAEETFWNQD